MAQVSQVDRFWAALDQLVLVQAQSLSSEEAIRRAVELQGRWLSDLDLLLLRQIIHALAANTFRIGGVGVYNTILSQYTEGRLPLPHLEEEDAWL